MLELNQKVNQLLDLEPAIKHCTNELYRLRNEMMVAQEVSVEQVEEYITSGDSLQRMTDKKQELQNHIIRELLKAIKVLAPEDVYSFLYVRDGTQAQARLFLNRNAAGETRSDNPEDYYLTII